MKQYDIDLCGSSGGGFETGDFESQKERKIIGEDNICPETGEQCDDECCPPGSECNLSCDGDGIKCPEPEAAAVPSCFAARIEDCELEYYSFVDLKAIVDYCTKLANIFGWTSPQYREVEKICKKCDKLFLTRILEIQKRLK